MLNECCKSDLIVLGSYVIFLRENLVLPFLEFYILNLLYIYCLFCFLSIFSASNYAACCAQILPLSNCFRFPGFSVENAAQLSMLPEILPTLLGLLQILLSYRNLWFTKRVICSLLLRSLTRKEVHTLVCVNNVYLRPMYLFHIISPSIVCQAQRSYFKKTTLNRDPCSCGLNYLSARLRTTLGRIVVLELSWVSFHPESKSFDVCLTYWDGSAFLHVHYECIHTA